MTRQLPVTFKSEAHGVLNRHLDVTARPIDDEASRVVSAAVHAYAAAARSVAPSMVPASSGDTRLKFLARNWLGSTSRMQQTLHASDESNLGTSAQRSLASEWIALRRLEDELIAELNTTDRDQTALRVVTSRFNRVSQEALSASLNPPKDKVMQNQAATSPNTTKGAIR